jgi:division protein 1
MTPKMLNSAASTSSRTRGVVTASGVNQHRMDFATLGRAPFRLGIGARRICSRDLQIIEATEELLDAEVPEPEGVASDISLLRGFNATIPSAEKSRSRRRQMRIVDMPRIGLKNMGRSARGLLAEDEADEDDDAEGEHEGRSVASEDDLVVVARDKKSGKRRGKESLSAGKTFGRQELARQTKEIKRDKENIHIRRVRCPPHRRFFEPS